MAILPGFEYDIFISYRHNDNLPSQGSGRQASDGWVTDFVQNLEKELKGTLKDSVTIYFDRNPHDGLLETHNVDKSLEGKLKCLIFIPIISQTYCDTKSFAWQHEFVAFNKLAGEDTFGRDIKLSNGNVASRILPIKIHDLDAEDKSLFENELAGVLRAIDFIYKDVGVNRPLIFSDARSENINRTYYRDQINKTANAVKEIILGLKNAGKINHVVIKSQHQQGGRDETGNRSIAVLPFVNMSSDPEQEYFSDGMAEEIINSLVHLKDLKVAGRTSSFQFKGKNPDLREVGERLGVKTVLEGSIRKQGNLLRITAQLINVEDGFHLWSERYDRTLDDIFAIQDEIALAITEKLQITLMGKDREKITKSYTENPEAYFFYLKGRFYLNKRLLHESLEQFEKAIAIDPLYARAYAGVADASIILTNYGFLAPGEIMPKAKLAAKKAIELDDSLCEPYCSLALYYASFEWNWSEAKKNFKRSIELNPAYTQAYIWYGQYYMTWVEGNYREGEKLVEIAIKLEPLSAIGYLSMFAIQCNNGKPEEAFQMAKEGFALDQDSYISQRVMGLAFAGRKEFGKATECLEKASSMSKRSAFSLADLIYLYMQGGMVDKAQEVRAELEMNMKERKYTSPFIMGYAYSNLGNFDEAFNWFEKAYENHDGFLFMMRNYPWLPDKLKTDERFISLMKRLKVPNL